MSTPRPSRPAWLLFILEAEHTFKAVAFVYFILLFAATFGVFKALTDDPQPFSDFGVLVAVLAVFFGGILAHLTLRALGADRPLFDDRRSKVFLIVGFGAAILLAALLSIYNHTGTVLQNKSEENGRAQRERLGHFSN